MSSRKPTPAAKPAGTFIGVADTLERLAEQHIKEEPVEFKVTLSAKVNNLLQLRHTQSTERLQTLKITPTLDGTLEEIITLALGNNESFNEWVAKYNAAKSKIKNIGDNEIDSNLNSLGKGVGGGQPQVKAT